MTTSPNFASKWLVHRLGRFAQAHPNIDLRVSASLHHVDFAREDIDVAARHGDGRWPGLQVTRLCTEVLFPVCSPKLLRGRHELRTPGVLRRHVLLHLDDRRDWEKWLEAAGVDGADLARGPVFNQRRPARRSQAASAVRASRMPAVWSRAGGTLRLLRHPLTVDGGVNRHARLDCLPSGDRGPTEDHRLPRLAGRRGGGDTRRLGAVGPLT